MNLFQELRQRRVFRITTGYVVGCWGLLQFLAFLESRMAISPHLVNLVGLGLLLLAPSVITLAWVHGKPGKDSWSRTSKIVVPANLIAVGLLLLIVFQGRDLGAVTETIAVEDENGTVTERVVPKNEYRRRVFAFYPDNLGPAEDAWATETLAYLLRLDANQDVFLDVVLPFQRPNSLRNAGSEDGHDLPRAKQRKLARDAHIGHFLSGSLQHRDGQWRLTTELNESETGKITSRRTVAAGDLFSLADAASRQLREDLGIPAAHLEENPDLPISEMTSADIQAVASHVRATLMINHFNDWEGALPHLEDAVRRDPQYALAQFDLFSVRQSLGDGPGSSTAIAAAMENLYRVPERLSFPIKAQYYYNEKEDPEKALAVVNMWARIYPDDVDAYQFQALFYFVQQDLPPTIAAYEKILTLDPSRVDVLADLADLHTQLGNFDEAERSLKRYVEIYPTRADGYEDLSDFYSTIGRMAEARDALAQAQLLDPENEDLALSLIDLNVKAGKYPESEKALADLLVTADTARDSLRLYGRQIMLASLKGRADDLAVRLESFHDALLKTQNPLQAHLIYSMAVPAISEVGRPHDALERLAAVRPLISPTYQDLVGVGEAWAYAELGRVEEAAASLAAATVVVEKFKFETFRSTLALIKGMIAEAGGDLDGAIPLYRQAMDQAIRIEPTFRIRLIRGLRLAGKRDEAWDILQECLKSDPVHPRYMLELAHLEKDRGNLEEAHRHLAIALAAWAEAAPEFPFAQEARRLADQIQ
jgi:tetratricopeptide (TPR) repeat protein